MARAEGKANTYTHREPWLHGGIEIVRGHFEKVGVPLPTNIRVSVGFSSKGRKSNVCGECWQTEASKDGHYEIFIHPKLDEPVEVLGVLVHELIHAACPSGAGHGKLYKAAALKVGLEGKMRSAMPGPLLQERLNALAADLGPYPHASLNSDMVPTVRRKKQTTRMLKAECGGVEDEPCGYTVRLTAKWVQDLGAPHCPKHGAMTVDLPADEDEAADEE